MIIIIILTPPQELVTAAMGLNTSLIEDVRLKRRVLSLPCTASELKALSSPSFAVTQALVGLLAKAGGLGLGRIQEQVKGRLGSYL
jgi:hypothetical protein